MHEAAIVGTVLRVEPPQNDFPLASANNHLLIAGGIGVTPILAMARRLHAEGRPFRLVYLTRFPEETAYRTEIAAEFGDNVTFHHDDGDPAKAFDFWELLEKPKNGHVYCCGPAPLMEEIKGMTGHWPEGRVHFEDFKPTEVVRPDDRAFNVTLAGGGQVIHVPADRSILEALREAGIRTVSSCESGTCGTCRTRLVNGDVEHRDMVLMDEEKRDNIMICVSRAASGDLVIDL